MANDSPDVGDTPGFAKALAELKKDVPSGEDPLFFDVTKGARLLTREERQKIFDAARNASQAGDPDVPALPVALSADAAAIAPLPTDTVRVPVELIRAPWPLWARAGITAAVLIVLFAAALRYYLLRSSVVANAPPLVDPAPATTAVMSDSPASAASAPSSTETVAASAAAAPAAKRARPLATPLVKPRVRRELPPPELAPDKPLNRPTIDNPDRY